jgi:hypothetical protein
MGLALINIFSQSLSSKAVCNANTATDWFPGVPKISKSSVLGIMAIESIKMFFEGSGTAGSYLSNVNLSL